VTRWAIADTGPLVALFDKSERRHAWTVRQVELLDPPMILCEPVLVEVMFLLGKNQDVQDALLELLANDVLRIAFRLDEHLAEVKALRSKYRDLPMSLTDACLVRMAELYEKHSIFTFDSHFAVYRKNGKEPLKLIYPGAEA
jgi:uncharacterized protein